MAKLEHPSDKLLEEFVNGKLNKVEEGIIKRHLRKCESCRRKVERLKSGDSNPGPPPSVGKKQRPPFFVNHH